MANPNPELHPENLRPAKPGEVRNPKGSSGKQRLTNALIKLIEEKGLDDPFVRVGMEKALKGDFRFWQYLFDRVDGPLNAKNEDKDKEADDGKGILIPTTDPRFAPREDRRPAAKRARKRKPAP